MEERELHEMQSVRQETAHLNTAAPKVPEATHELTFLSRASSRTVREPVVRHLHTSLWPLVVFIFYAALSAFTWTVFCIASKRPIGSKQDYGNQDGYRKELDAILTKHENAIKAAQIIQVVVALITIPITSAICSMALASFIQTGGARTKLNLRQTMALADQGWISPRIWTMCSKVGSLPLYIAFGLTLVDLWFTPLPSDYNTGVYKELQYVPRINTTVTYTNMTAAGWPSECVRDKEGVFFAEYHSRRPRVYDVDLTACMPTNISDTPWQATHNRQDITEELYLNITAGYEETPLYYRVTAKTSLGYFELPSAKNGNRAGPLLDNCSLPRIDNWGSRDSSWDKGLAVRDTNGSYTGNVTQSIGKHIGPLTTLGLALFGEGSYIEKRVSNPSAFVINRTKVYDAEYDAWYTPWSSNCDSSMPLSFAFTSTRECDVDYDHKDEDDIIGEVRSFVNWFSLEDTAREAFTVGAYLANKDWLDQARGYTLSYDAKRAVVADPGVTISKNKITIVEIIIGSIFLGLHLLGLLVLAIYAVYGKPFVPWLGGEVMVKAGTVHADILSAAEGHRQWKQTMAACPGFVGDERPTDSVGRIAFGAVAGLSRLRDRKFETL
ncbi:unnamed protein product [Alternaria alternata]